MNMRGQRCPSSWQGPLIMGALYMVIGVLVWTIVMIAMT